jgi:hypothetical protein
VKGGAIPVAVWGALLVLLGAGLAVWSDSPISLFLVGGGALMLGLAILDWLTPVRHESRVLPRVSVPVVLVALGAALAAIGLTAGLWLSLLGGELSLFGLLWLRRERLAERRLRR